MASRIAKTPLLQFQRQLAAQASPAAIKKPAASEGIEVRTKEKCFIKESNFVQNVIKVFSIYNGSDMLFWLWIPYLLLIFKTTHSVNLCKLNLFILKLLFVR